MLYGVYLFLKYGVQKDEEITPQFPIADSKTLKSMNCITSWSSKPIPGAFLFPLFLADLDKKHRNEIEMDKNNSVTYIEYVDFQVRVSRMQRKSLPNFQVQIKKN